jgi:hypothetical protein
MSFWRLCNKPYPYSNRNPNSNPNQISKKPRKETTLEIDQMT